VAALLTALERGQTRARLRSAAIVLAGVAVLAAGAAGLRHWGTVRRVAACEAAGAEIDEAWNDAARLRIKEAVVATGVPYAATTAEKTTPWLDERAETWKRARTAVCLNADVRAVWDADLLDRALWCLEDRHMELSSLIAELGRADDTTVQKAVTAAARLRPVDSCVDERRLQRQPAPPTQGRIAIRDVRAQLSRAYSLELAGDFTTALTIATAAREQARAIPDWPSLLASALIREGHLLIEGGNFAAAEAASAEAYYTAASAGAWELAAEAAIDLASNVGDFQQRFDDGREWAKHARMTLVHAGDPEGLSEAGRLSNLANVHHAAGEYAEARALHERVVRIREQILGPDHPNVGFGLHNLANAHQKLDAYVEAQALYERALHIFEQALGYDHPRVAQTLGNLATAYAATGKNAEARLLHERSLALTEKIYGADHYHVASSLNNLAILHVNTGDLDAARVLLERALAINERAFGPDHLDVASNLGNLASLDHRADAHAIALTRYERALAIREKALGPDHLDVALALSSIAYVLLDLKRDRDAIPLLERSLTIFTAHEGIQYGELMVKYGLATALFFTRGDRARVLALVTEVRDGARDSGDATLQAEVEKIPH
jgi:tetratricopeptide (TPR) repeat protein